MLDPAESDDRDKLRLKALASMTDRFERDGTRYINARAAEIVQREIAAYAALDAKDAEIARLQAELAAVRQPNWRRGGVWGERAATPLPHAKHIFIDNGAAGRREVLLVDHDDDGGGWWPSCYRVDWEYIAWWIPLDELLDTIPEERP